MNDRKDDPQLCAHLEQKPQQRDRINPGRNRYSNALPSFQQFVLSNVGENALRKGVHANMVQQW